MAKEQLTHVEEKNWQEVVVNSSIPVLVDFWAEWCAPCKAIVPMLVQVAEEQQGKLKVVKINVDQEINLATQHQVRSIPTLLLFKEGKVVERMVGALHKTQLEEKILSHTNSD